MKIVCKCRLQFFLFFYQLKFCWIIFLAGIWIRDIRAKCNLVQNQVSKILKNLESKKSIKAVKSVSVSTRKLLEIWETSRKRKETM